MQCILTILCVALSESYNKLFFQLLERARDPSFIPAMMGSMSVADALFAELCKADQAQSVFVLPRDSGNLRQRICAADRMELMEFARDLYRRVNVSAVRREVNKLSSIIEPC